MNYNVEFHKGFTENVWGKIVKLPLKSKYNYAAVKSTHLTNSNCWYIINTETCKPLHHFGCHTITEAIKEAVRKVTENKANLDNFHKSL